jgi:hypothetical protein
LEAVSLNMLDEIGAGGHHHVVAGVHGRAGQRQHRVDVAVQGPADKQHAHGRLSAIDRGSSAARAEAVFKDRDSSAQLSASRCKDPRAAGGA